MDYGTARSGRPWPFANLLIRGLGVGLVIGLLAACGSASRPSVTDDGASQPALGTASSVPTANQRRLATGTPAEGLDFQVVPNASNAIPPTAPSLTIAPKASAEAAIAALGDAIVKGDAATALGLLTAQDRERIGSPVRFQELLAQDPSWTASEVAAVDTAAGSVDLLVHQRPSIDEIRGVVAATATVRLTAREEDGGWRVVWRRRQVSQHYAAPEAKLTTDVAAWAQGRIRCASPPGATPEGEFGGGLFGIVGLADKLCHAKQPPVVGVVGDFDSLDDPQPLIDTFGSASALWARVVTLTAPTPMKVVAAPLGDRWIVVGIAPGPVNK